MAEGMDVDCGDGNAKKEEEDAEGPMSAPGRLMGLGRDVVPEMPGDVGRPAKGFGRDMDRSATTGAPLVTFGKPSGRARSGAITGRRVYFGYLDSCEKCRNRVSGHLMHIIP